MNEVAQIQSQPSSAGPTPPSAPPTPHNRNIFFTALGEGLWGFQVAMATPVTVLALLLSNHGAGKAMIGSITALEGGMTVLPQMIGMYLFRSTAKRKVQLILWHFAFIIPYYFALGLAAWFGPLLGNGATRWMLISFFFLSCMGTGSIMSVWMEWMASVFPQTLRGKAMGISFCAASVAGALGAVISGRVLVHSQEPPVFGLIYITAGLISIVAILCFSFIHDPAAHAPPKAAAPQSWAMLLGRFRLSLADRNFRSFLVGRVLAMMGLCVLPLVAVHYSSPLGGALSDGFIVTAGAGQTFMHGLATLIYGWLGDHYGHRLAVLTGAGMQVVFLLIVLTTAGPASCIAAYLVLGLCTAAGFVTHYNLLFETCPHDHRLAHITLGSLLFSTVMIPAPLIGGAAAERWGMGPLLGVCVALSLASFLWFIFVMKEPRSIAYPLPTPEGESAADPA
ncbi:MAG: MFS transporter [Phycisphaeraceae bacterium]|nr:MFS transporter [Phycisphaeraceae bacterium]